jgi:deoxycytidylate deaminase
MLINAGIRRVVFEGEYPDEFALQLFRDAHVVLERFSGPTSATERVEV